MRARMKTKLTKNWQARNYLRSRSITVKGDSRGWKKLQLNGSLLFSIHNDFAFLFSTTPNIWVNVLKKSQFSSTMRSANLANSTLSSITAIVNKIQTSTSKRLFHKLGKNRYRTQKIGYESTGKNKGSSWDKRVFLTSSKWMTLRLWSSCFSLTKANGSLPSSSSKRRN